MHPQESKLFKRFVAPGARMQAEWEKVQSSHHSPPVVLHYAQKFLSRTTKSILPKLLNIIS